jgi:hypothetical protein
MRRYLLAIFACFLSSTLLAADPPASTFRAGAATSNITPALGSAIIGGFLPFPATNVHDQLHAKCLVLDDGKTKLALVVVDLLGFHYIVSHEARKFIEQETGIPPTNVLISATHTHSAASALGKNHFEFPQKVDEYQVDEYQACPTRSSARSGLNSASGVPCSRPSWSPWRTAISTTCLRRSSTSWAVTRHGFAPTAWSRRHRKGCSTRCWKWRRRSAM